MTDFFEKRDAKEKGREITSPAPTGNREEKQMLSERQGSNEGRAGQGRAGKERGWRRAELEFKSLLKRVVRTQHLKVN